MQQIPEVAQPQLLEVAESLGELAKEGVRPKRTIVFAAWDAEEFGILGSTEWVEELKTELQQKVIAYLNVDIAATGRRFYVSATPSLREMIRDVTENVIDPRTLKPVYENWKTRQNKEIPQIGNLGSGSDHSPFVGHAGISAVSMGFGGAYGVLPCYAGYFLLDGTFRRPDVSVSSDDVQNLGDACAAACQFGYSAL